CSLDGITNRRLTATVARSGRDLADAAALVKEPVRRHAVAPKVDGDVGLARLGPGARGILRQLGRRIDPGLAGGAAHAKVGARIDVLLQLHPGAAVLAVGLVDPQLLLHVPVGQVVDQLLVANPDVLRHAVRPVLLGEDGRRIRVTGLLLEVDAAVIAHARVDAARVAEVDVLVADRAVVGARQGDQSTPGGAVVRDAHEVHGDLDVAPLRRQRGIVHVHARDVAADLEDAGTVGVVGRVAVVRVEPGVAGVDARERARLRVVPLGEPGQPARERGLEHGDPEPVDGGRPRGAGRAVDAAAAP